MRRIAEDTADRKLPAAPYWRMARAWFWLGIPAFAAMVTVVVLMVSKHIPGGIVNKSLMQEALGDAWATAAWASSPLR